MVTRRRMLMVPPGYASRFPGRGQHTLLRARDQWSLHEALLTTRAPRAAMLAAG
jgi:hypothetical protein